MIISPATEAGTRARHAAVRDRSRRAPAKLPAVPAVPAADPGLLRGQGEPDPAIVRTLYKEGASFDVASMPEFMIVHENIKDLPAKERQDWIWDKIIYANPTKPPRPCRSSNQYKPLVTFDNCEEIRKIKRHAPQCGAGSAAQGAEYRRDGRALLEVRGRRRARRST